MGDINIYNRRYLDDVLLPRLAKSISTQGFGLVFVDLDGLSDINAQLSHTGGNILLKALALTLQKYGSPEICRLGADEFVFAIEDQNKELVSRIQAVLSNLQSVALNDELMKPILDPEELKVYKKFQETIASNPAQCSIGACYVDASDWRSNQHTITLHPIFEFLDEAVDKSKKEGKARANIFQITQENKHGNTAIFCKSDDDSHCVILPSYPDPKSIHRIEFNPSLDSKIESDHALLHAATTHPLTGLMNKESFELVGVGILQDVIFEKKPLTVLMLDLDSLKRFNDSVGHFPTDSLIRTFAEILRELLGIPFVYGSSQSDEFGFLIPYESLERVKQTIEGIMKSFTDLPSIFAIYDFIEKGKNGSLTENDFRSFTESFPAPYRGIRRKINDTSVDWWKDADNFKNLKVKKWKSIEELKEKSPEGFDNLFKYLKVHGSTVSIGFARLHFTDELRNAIPTNFVNANKYFSLAFGGLTQVALNNLQTAKGPHKRPSPQDIASGKVKNQGVGSIVTYNPILQNFEDQTSLLTPNRVRQIVIKGPTYEQMGLSYLNQPKE